MRKFILILFLLCPIVSANGGENLPSELKDAVTSGNFSLDGIGLYVQAVDADQPLLSHQAGKLFNPASVIKLVTTAASLGELGAGYRWSTGIWYTGTLDGDTLKGDLYFRGNGDPYLTPERFWRMLNRIRIYGIRHIEGDIILDTSYFKPAKPDYAAFDEQPYRTYNVGPNALLVGFQATEFHFDASNGKVEITAFPASPRLQIINRVKSVKGSCGAWSKRLLLEPEVVEGVLQVTFTGRYSATCGKRTLYRRVAGREDHFQHFFLSLWQQLGGSFSGEIKHGSLPVNATQALDASSVSLAEAISLINKFSNNVMTRQLLLSLGAHVYGPPGTTEKGIAAVKAWLKKNNLNGEQLQLDNGAGLSRDTRVSAGMLGRLLHFVYQQAYMPEFISSMPLAGFDGTMAHRFKGEPITGQAHIKTGLLDFVQTMAGYVTAASGQRFIVVLLHNDPGAHTREAEQLQNALIRWVYSQN